MMLASDIEPYFTLSRRSTRVRVVTNRVNEYNLCIRIQNIFNDNLDIETHIVGLCGLDPRGRGH
jgi:hypothetical protein